MGSLLAVENGTSSGSRPSASAISPEFATGSHVFTIHGYSHLKGLAIEAFYSSGSFTAAGGHRWSVLFYPNGAEKYSNYSYGAICLRLDDTCYASSDDDVKARFRFSLLKPDGQTSHHSQESGCIRVFTRGVHHGVYNFPKRSDVELYAAGDNGDDSVRIRCDITVFNLMKVTNDDDAAEASRSFVVVPPSDVDRHLGHLLASGQGADVELEVDGETFPAHRNILAARSPVFKAQLFGPMKGNTSGGSVEIRGIEAGVFRAFLHFIYNDSLPAEIGGDGGAAMAMVQHLLVVADRYGMERMKLVCEDKLCRYIEPCSVGTMLALAEQHGCHGLKKACLKFLASGTNLKAAIKTDGFDHLAKSCPSVLKELLLAKLAP